MRKRISVVSSRSPSHDLTAQRHMAALPPIRTGNFIPILGPKRIKCTCLSLDFNRPRSAAATGDPIEALAWGEAHARCGITPETQCPDTEPRPKGAGCAPPTWLQSISPPPLLNCEGDGIRCYSADGDGDWHRGPLGRSRGHLHVHLIQAHIARGTSPLKTGVAGTPPIVT